ncbi:MAG TPA: DNA-directed RNA polymerase subunit alpha, partial [Candidatus Monoglobus merdigallinarum]|nr:DNA-directed RNA polymerase subunit alpha [Candidatus Monoglobus merdigallinarum]
MIEIEKPRIECVESSEDERYAKFVIEPLERGYGTTLGNSLRRMLLSSLPGVASTSVKIDGVLHEFSTIPGVKEDVTEIILNIKNLVIKLHSDGPKTIYINQEGAGEVCARDIKHDADVEILNGDMHIATLDEDAKLFMEITINRGRGYVSSEQNKEQIQGQIGVIATDSIFTPVEKVNYYTDKTRVGNVSDYDKLTLEIWTNGTITPAEAVSLAAKIISEHLSLFIDLSDDAKNVEIMIEKEEG